MRKARLLREPFDLYFQGFHFAAPAAAALSSPTAAVSSATFGVTFPDATAFTICVAVGPSTFATCGLAEITWIAVVISEATGDTCGVPAGDCCERIASAARFTSFRSDGAAPAIAPVVPPCRYPMPAESAVLSIAEIAVCCDGEHVAAMANVIGMRISFMLLFSLSLSSGI